MPGFTGGPDECTLAGHAILWNSADEMPKIPQLVVPLRRSEPTRIGSLMAPELLKP
jgi:hypothetical protein